MFITRSLAPKERCALDWLASGTGLGNKTWLQAKLSSHLTGRPLGTYSWSSADAAVWACYAEGVTRESTLL